MNTPIGFIVSWKVPPVVDLAALRKGIAAAGLDPVELAPDLLPPSIVARSSSLIAHSTSVKGERRLARRVSRMTRQITRELAAADVLAYSRQGSIGYDETAGKLTSDDTSIEALLDEAAANVSNTRTASDVTRILQRVVSNAGSDLIPVREQGGAYFIPQGAAIIDTMDVVLKSVDGELSRFACTIGHGSDESVANTITDYVLKQIAELRESVEELNEDGPVRADVKSRRLSRVAELRDRISSYAALVNEQGDKLTDALGAAETSLLAKLGEVANA